MDIQLLNILYNDYSCYSLDIFKISIDDTEKSLFSITYVEGAGLSIDLLFITIFFEI